MWSSLTLRRSKDKTRDDTIAAAGGDKDSDTVNKKLTRAATFCYDSKYKEQNTKKSLLRNFPKVRNYLQRIKVKRSKKSYGYRRHK
jgi:hypothetical protein